MDYVLRVLAVVTGIALAACEAPLNLEQVDAEDGRTFHRYDMLQAAAHSGARVAVVSSQGAIILSEDNGESWQRFELPGRPALIDVTACPAGQFFALDSGRRVWSRAVSYTHLRAHETTASISYSVVCL